MPGRIFVTTSAAACLSVPCFDGREEVGCGSRFLLTIRAGCDSGEWSPSDSAVRSTVGVAVPSFFEIGRRVDGADNTGRDVVATDGRAGVEVVEEDGGAMRSVLGTFGGRVSRALEGTSSPDSESVRSIVSVSGRFFE